MTVGVRSEVLKGAGKTMGGRRRHSLKPLSVGADRWLRSLYSTHPPSRRVEEPRRVRVETPLSLQILRRGSMSTVTTS